MAYTDVWDVTAPLDTQAANQGAVDFRATKLDIMQRVASFGAGLLAARPTPETTGATADWTGVTYLATDTNQLFRWSGAAWVDISASTPGTGGSTIVDTTVITRASPNPIGADQLENSVTALAGSYVASNVLTLTHRFSVTHVGGASNATAQITLGIGGNFIFNTFNIPDTDGEYAITATLVVVNNTHIRGLASLTTLGGTLVGAVTIFPVDIVVADLSANTLLFAITKTVAGVVGHTNNNTYVFDMLTVVRN